MIDQDRITIELPNGAMIGGVALYAAPITKDPTLQHLPEPPIEIIHAANVVAHWCETNGITDWRIGPVACRKLLEKTERHLAGDPSTP